LTGLAFFSTIGLLKRFAMKFIRSLWLGLSLGLYFASIHSLDAVTGDEHWSQEFGLPGVTNQVGCFTTHEGRLYMGGSRTSNTNAYLISWDGVRFRYETHFTTRPAPSVSEVLASVSELVSFQGALYAAGRFITVNNQPIVGVARWEGDSWSGLGFTNGTIYALAVWGNDLYVGGSFTNIGNVTATNIARWDGSAWHALGAGLSRLNASANGIVFDLLVTNSVLYAGGEFTSSGSATMNRVASWNGSAWSNVGAGVFLFSVRAMTFYRDELHIGGTIYGTQNEDFHDVGRWNGQNWFSLGPGVSNSVRTLAVFQDRLHAGTGSSAGLSSWDGTNWQHNVGGTFSSINTLRATATNLLVGVGNSYGVATFSEQGWIPLYTRGKSAGVNTGVFGIAVTPHELLAAGAFTAAQITNVPYVGRYDGTNWFGFSDAVNDVIKSVAVVGDDVYISGDFLFSTNNVPLYHAARWTTNGWDSLAGAHFPKDTRLLAAGNNLYLYGSYLNTEFPEPDRSFVRWDGTNLHHVLQYPPTWTYNVVEPRTGFSAVAASGSNLYVSGWFSFSDTTTNGEPMLTCSNALYFDGEYTRFMGSGLNSNALAIAVMGTNVFFGGTFTLAGGVPVNGIARWDGANWWDVGGGVVGRADIRALAVIGTNLYAGGFFTNIGGVSAKGIARWDGTAWSPLGSGLFNGVNPAAATSFAVRGNDLYVAGALIEAGGKSSRQLARWNETRNFNDPAVRFHGASKPLNGAFTSLITTEGGANYLIERSTDFIIWSPVLTNSVSPFTLVDSNAPIGPKHFYRAVTVP
jgi:hypothetical protein